MEGERRKKGEAKAAQRLRNSRRRMRRRGFSRFSSGPRRRISQNAPLRRKVGALGNVKAHVEARMIGRGERDDKLAGVVHRLRKWREEMRNQKGRRAKDSRIGSSEQTITQPPHLVHRHVVVAKKGGRHHPDFVTQKLLARQVRRAKDAVVREQGKKIRSATGNKHRLAPCRQQAVDVRSCSVLEASLVLRSNGIPGVSREGHKEREGQKVGNAARRHIDRPLKIRGAKVPELWRARVNVIDAVEVLVLRVPAKGRLPHACETTETAGSRKGSDDVCLQSNARHGKPNIASRRASTHRRRGTPC